MEIFYTTVIETSSEKQIPYINTCLLERPYFNFVIKAAHPIIDENFHGTEIPYSLTIEITNENMIEPVRRELMHLGWNYFKLTQVYFVPSMDPGMAQAMEQAADDRGELPS